MAYQYDVTVIGAGPAGYEAALKLAKTGKKVLIVEKEYFGGVCTNRGCIPTKALLNCAKTFLHAKDGGKFGVHCNPSFSLSEAMALKEETVQTLRNGIEMMLEKASVEKISGTAYVQDAHTVSVGAESYSTEMIILASGSNPMIVPIKGLNDNKKIVLDSNSVLDLDNLPSSIVIIGGGVIGIEFASLFSMLDVKVSVVEMLDDILPMMDGDLTKIIRREMKGVDFFLGSSVQEIKPSSVVIKDSKEKELEIPCEKILLATGRKPNTDCVDGLGLEMNGRYIKVNEYMQTSIDNIYAIGDVNGVSMLAHSASKMAEIAAYSILGNKERFDANCIPWAVYSYPESSGCGLTEKKATELGYEVKTTTKIMRSNGRFLAENTKKSSGVVKVVKDCKTDKLLGLFIVGPYASEMIWGASLAISSGLTCREISETVFPHPSVSEVIKSAMYDE